MYLNPAACARVLQNRTAKRCCATQSEPLAYAFAAALNPFTATLSRDLYRFPVFSSSTPLLIAWSIAESVGRSSVPADAESFAAIAVRSFFMMVRTRVVFARFISARTRDCLARLMTDFLRFFTFVA